MKFRLLMGVALVASLSFGTAVITTAEASVKPRPLGKIGFLMPCSTCAARFETQDKPRFIEAVRKLDPKIQVIANNAQGSEATQINQAQDAIANGVKVLVVSPITTSAGVAIVNLAKRSHVQVISYDGLLTGAKVAFYVSFDNVKVGQLQGQYLASNLPAGSTVVMINGDPTSTPGVQFKQGALSALQPLFTSGKLKLGASYDTPLWDPATGTTEMQQALTSLNNQVQGVLSANDGLAGGIIAALRSQNLAGKVLVTGQDASIAGLQDILLGTQSMTIFKPILSEATVAAEVAVGLVKGTKNVIGKIAKTKVSNGAGQVPSVLLAATVVTKANISIVAKDGGATWAQICTGIPASACPSH
jgi:D-xylose transport system substrate-binding protein